MNDANALMQHTMLQRLARVEGQIRGIQRLIREGHDCEKIAQQMSAARRALDKACHEMLACMIEQDVLATVEKPTEATVQQMAEIKNLLNKYA